MKDIQGKILSGSTQIESSFCPAWCQIFAQYRFGVKFVHARHLALKHGRQWTGQIRRLLLDDISTKKEITSILF